MPSKALVVLLGHAGRDGEMRFTPNGAAVYSFSMATSRWMGKDREPATTWWQVDLWGKRAESLNEGDYGVRKGTLVQVSGEAYEEEWTDREGNTRKTLRVRADDVVSLGGKDEREAAPAAEFEDTPF